MEQRGGVFIDIGAHDGITFSNSYFFEKFRNFQCICVEPNPIVFSRLQKNRMADNINACVGNKNGKARFLALDGYSEMLSGLLDYYEPFYLDRIDKAINEHGGDKKIIEVDVITFDALIRGSKSRIDVCSIDTEGNEFEIIKSIDFSKSDFFCFTIENIKNEKELDDFMIDHGYTPIIRLVCDTIYVNDKYFTIGLRYRLLVFKFKKKVTSLFKFLKKG